MISSEMKYYLAINRRNFMQVQSCMAFTGMLCRFTIRCDVLLLKEHIRRTQGSYCLERYCWKHHWERALKFCYCMKSFM